MPEDMARAFASQERALVVAAAGCGKTELVAKAVAANQGGRELILTHTHAGVRALRDRLRAMSAEGTSYRVDTIAAFSLRYAASFPRLSGCRVDEPSNHDQWVHVYEAAVRALGHRHIRSLVNRSYSGVFVDEYQDCTSRQHQLILTLAELLPTRVVGDPLQGIFGFSKDDPLVDWSRQVYPVFKRLPDLNTPYRWQDDNPALGEWLTCAREALLSGQPVKMEADAPVAWVKLGDSRMRQAAQVRKCFELLQRSGESVAIIRKWPKQAHAISKVLKGRYRSMEEVECKDLLEWCARLEGVCGIERAALAVEFALLCMTRKAQPLNELSKLLHGGQFPGERKLKKYIDLKSAAWAVVNGGPIVSIGKMLGLIANMPDVTLHRKELYREMQKVTQNHDESSGISLRSMAWRIRDGARKFGRFIDPRVVSRTTLVKGLEFDHAVIVNADDFDDAKNLYVALTRGARSLTIMSESRRIQRPAPGV